MQTFLPYQSFIESAKCLDYRRLGKQRVEAYQLLLAMQDKHSSWRNHPCFKMWKDYEDALKLYHDIMIAEWVRRGYKNTMKPYCGEQFLSTMLTVNYQELSNISIPDWLDDDFCSRHRAALLYKDYDFYSQYGWKEEPKLDYRWGK